MYINLTLHEPTYLKDSKCLSTKYKIKNLITIVRNKRNNLSHVISAYNQSWCVSLYVYVLQQICRTRYSPVSLGNVSRYSLTWNNWRSISEIPRKLYA